MPIPYRIRKERIKELYDFEVSHNFADENRLTYGDPDFPMKKPYVDIRELCGRLFNLKYSMKKSK